MNTDRRSLFGLLVSTLLSSFTRLWATDLVPSSQLLHALQALNRKEEVLNRKLMEVDELRKKNSELRRRNMMLLGVVPPGWKRVYDGGIRCEP